MITVEEAYSLIQGHRLSLPVESASIEKLIPQTVAEDLFADRDSPPFHRVMMDGICVAWETYAAGLRAFRVAGTCAAGVSSRNLPSPEACFEIMTGASLPKNAELVIPYEHIEISDGVARVTVEAERTRFENVHLSGSDCAQGAKVLAQGNLLNGPHWGIAASFGYENVRALKKPKVQIVSTGDELVEVGATPLAHQIRRSNAFALKASLLQNHFPEIDLHHLPDDPEAIRKHYDTYADQFDVLIFSGGVSRGKFDYLPKLFEELGVNKIFHGVRQRPGKPLFFGVDKKRNTTVYGLPGNPVSSLVCLHRYFLPQRKMFAELSRTITFAKDLTFFVPVKVEFTPEAKLIATPLSIKNSGEFTALAESDGFLELPREKNEFSAGEAYPFYPWGRL